jgi:glycosyltransferase involved in cell wall biosynthesis
MHIVNLMFSRGSGGIEQAFVDYCQGLSARGHRITAIAQPGAAVLPELAALGVEVITLRNRNMWDPFARFRLRRIMRRLAPDVVIGHGIRAFTLGRSATNGICPMVGVTHNYSTRRLQSADAVFAITRALRERVISQWVEASHVYAVPNMVRVGALPARPARRTPPVIGTMGRFVHKKGFHVFIDALAILRQRGLAFTAVIGGQGDEEKALRALAEEKQLGDSLRFIGWVGDKARFFSEIDLFCLPSLHEPFGIVLLEAFAHGVPVVSTNSEGPTDIIAPEKDALLVEKDNALALADALERLLRDEEQARALALLAYQKVVEKYDMQAVCAQIEAALSEVIATENP